MFDEYDIAAFRVIDPKVVALARSPEGFASRRDARADGTLPDLRWIPTSNGVALGLSNCAACHTRLMPDGTLLRGAPPNEDTISDWTIQNGAVGGVASRARRRHAANDGVALVGGAVDQR